VHALNSEYNLNPKGKKPVSLVAKQVAKQLGASYADCGRWGILAG